MYGKVLGALIGAMIGLLASSLLLAIVLAVAGAFIGHLVDQSHAAPDISEIPEGRPSTFGLRPDARGARERASPAAPEAEAQGVFARHLCTLCIEVARSDGAIVQGEIRVIKDFFEQDLLFGPEEMERVRVWLKDAVANPRDLQAAARACRDELKPSERLLLLNALYEMALTDGPMKRAEGEAIKRVVAQLQIGEEDHRSITAMHFGMGAEHYAVLGLEAEASDDEVKAAYRRLAAANHPDKVAHLGPGAVEVAAKHFRDLKDAYDEVRRLRGLL